MFKQGAFQIDPNATPDQIARKRELIRAMMPKYGSARYVGEGLGQLFMGIGSGRQEAALDKQESAGRKSAADQFGRLFGTANSAQSPDVTGPLSVLGMTPQGGPPMPPPDPNSPHALGDATMAALGKPPVKTGAGAESIKAGLVARGLPDHIADGFVMNMQDESGLNPGINEAAPLVPGSRGGFGLYQLTGPRRRAYEAYATERGIPLDDVDAQLDFMMMELQGPEKAAWETISGTQNAGEAGAAIVNNFLRPAESHRASRAAEYLGGGGMPSSGAAPAGGQGGIPMAELQMAMMNPWLMSDPAMAGVINAEYQRQAQQSDPMYQLQLQQAQLELEAMRNPGKKPPIEVNGVLLDPDTFQPIYDGREPPKPTGDIQNYEYYKAQEIAEGRQPLSIAEWSVMDERAGNPGSGAPPDDEELRKKLAGKEGESWAAYMDAGTVSSGTMQDMQLLDELITLAPQGPISGRLASTFPGVNSAADAFTSVVKRVAPTLRAPGSGATSDIEYEGMLKSLPQLSSKPEANVAISAMMKAKAQLNMERGNIVAQYQNNEITAKEARTAMKEINSRSIMTPELEAILKATGPAPEASVESTIAPEGVEQEVWDALTPEERALWD